MGLATAIAATLGALLSWIACVVMMRREFDGSAARFHLAKSLVLVIWFGGPTLGAMLAAFAASATGANRMQGLPSPGQFTMDSFGALVTTALAAVAIYTHEETAYAVPAALLCTHAVMSADHSLGAGWRPAPALILLWFASGITLLLEPSDIADPLFARVAESVGVRYRVRDTITTVSAENVRSFVDTHTGSESPFVNAGLFTGPGAPLNAFSSPRALIAFLCLFIGALAVAHRREFVHSGLRGDKADFRVIFDPEQRGLENLHRFIGAFKPPRHVAPSPSSGHGGARR